MSLSQIGNYQAASLLAGTNAGAQTARTTQSTPGADVAPASTTPPVVAASAIQASDAIGDKLSEADKARLGQAVDSINRFIKPVNSAVEFSVDEKSGRTVVQVIDTDTKDVLRQFPSKQALAISQELDRYQGMLLKDKA